MKNQAITKKDLNQGFENMGKMIKAGFDGVDKRFEVVSKELELVNKRLALLESGQEDIKLRLDNVVYRFELKDLEERVIVLEKKARIKAS